MTQPYLSISLENPSRKFQPGELLSGQFRVLGAVPEEIRAVELSVLWYTEGKGDEDLSVHFFERVEPHEEVAIDFRQPRQFSTLLPNSPLSYYGAIIRICWCVRIRVFFWQGRDLSLDVPFQLGAVPHAVPAGTAATVS